MSSIRTMEEKREQDQDSNESKLFDNYVIENVIPKPNSEQIKKMNTAYFDEQAIDYDMADLSLNSTKNYVVKIDELIAKEFSRLPQVHKVLDVACGTGRRALHIQELSGKQYEITGADISEKMCRLAEDRGLRTFIQDWLDNSEPLDEKFDAVTFLYAFGHTPTHQERINTLKKINGYLSTGGLLFIDLFNKNNKNGWGPTVVEKYKKGKLSEVGYDSGDMFYRKRDRNEIGFLHYFDINEVEALLLEAGFEISNTKMIGYAKNAGEVLDSDDRGNYFIKARKVKHMTI
jgi:ubiquinone/menaquinone biosynthesis C-methylase UbiE